MLGADDDMDWDYYDYQTQEIEQKELMKGIAQFSKNVVYQNSKLIQDDKFNLFSIKPNMDDLHSKFGYFASHGAQLTKYAGNLKVNDKCDTKVDAIYQKAIIPKSYENQIINSSEDLRIKSGSVISTFPNTAIGLVLVVFKNGVVQRGTASMCGPNTAITAAHILKNGQDKNASPIENILFYPGTVGNHSGYKQVNVARGLVLNPKESIIDDIAILILDQPIGLFTGWYGLSSLSTEALQLQKIDITGYPIEKEQDGLLCQYTQSGKIEKVDSQNMHYKIEATSGQNGSSIVAERQISETESEYYILGIHTGRCSQNKSLNHGIRLNNDRLELIRSIMEFYILNESLDESFYNILISNQQHYVAEFDECNTNTNNASDLMYALRNNVDLKDIHIRIKNKQSKPILTDSCIKEFADSIRQLRYLETLKIDLFNCESLTDESLLKLGQGLGVLIDVAHIAININGNTKFSNNGIKDLLSQLQKLKNLKQLNLFLYNINGINDDVGKFIGSNIAQIPHIETVKLDFQMLKKVSEKGIKSIANSLEGCKKLQRLNFIFMGMNLPVKTKEDIRKKFSWMKNFSLI